MQLLMKKQYQYLLTINYQEYSLTSCQRTRHLITEVYMALGKRMKSLRHSHFNFCNVTPTKLYCTYCHANW